MLHTLCCDKYNIKYISRESVNCKIREIKYKEFINHEIEFSEWCRGNKEMGSKEMNIVSKITRKINPKDLINKLERSKLKSLINIKDI